ncbi:hypothetical protein HanRHA438_Chr10g0439471 [Helianthus annuus]|nr:hypothetical protein HanRHA438_Chr10g0439471 [Helianthus annuus]
MTGWSPVTAESRRPQWRQGSGGGCANRPLHLRYVRFSQVRLRFRRHSSTRFGSVQVLLGSDVVHSTSCPMNEPSRFSCRSKLETKEITLLLSSFVRWYRIEGFKG